MKKLILALAAACAISSVASASTLTQTGAAVDKTTTLEWCNPYYQGH